ncbi:hypothetical protein [Hymenobacter terrenus]|uniref:hypothetical protein n=1 Tax=Hymenobacter terrenus TaxID=1629124 RepID=UPI000619B897|nr:hypothetical protein [Hymenobacter terrenus]
MEIVLEVPDEDAARVLELIKGIKRVKVKSPKKAVPQLDINTQLAQDLREAGRVLVRIKDGEKLSRPARELLAELKDEL